MPVCWLVGARTLVAGSSVSYNFLHCSIGALVFSFSLMFLFFFLFSSQFYFALQLNELVQHAAYNLNDEE